MGDEKLTHDDYTVAWICPLEIEQIAALEMLNEEHPKLPQSANDHNVYTLGSVQGHNVVVAGLPTTGNCSAATVVAQMRNTFPRLRFGLLVGIGGGVPTKTDTGPIRLGHIVVSKPVGQHSGAVQYDHGKAEAGEFVRTGFLAPPPTVLLNAASALQVHRRRVSEDPLMPHLNRIDTSKRGLRAYKRPSPDQDQLYEPDYIHLDKDKSCKRCGCEASKRVNQDVENSDDESAYEEDDDWLVVHRGTIASGEAVMRNGLQRDALAGIDKILCFEMEAAGALNDFPCLVVRGISDYSDSHKNDKWHGYAAAVAAAYARELFYHMPVDEVKQCRISETDVNEMVQNTKKSARAADYTEDLRIKKWLGPADAYINYTSAFALHHENTGRWFLEGSRYEYFRDAPDARLWLRGIPGCGKTVLASTIIHDLQRRVDSTGSTVIFFFFSFSNESKQKLDHMLRSLIFQLSEMHQTAKDQLVADFKKHDDGKRPPHWNTLHGLFRRMVDTVVQTVTIVLDALDESTTKPELLKWIASFSSDHAKFLLTSRAEIDIEGALSSCLSHKSIITLDQEPVGDDIKAYVHHTLETVEKESWKSMHGVIIETLVEKAGGMFRWVYCQLETLAHCMDRSEVRQTLKTLPDDLNETYDHILQGIPSIRSKKAVKLLQLLAFSKRPLGLAEAVDAVATDSDSEVPFDPKDRIHPPREIIGYCSSLLRLTEEDGHHPQLELAHFSVREYLMLDRRANPYSEDFQEIIANASITRTCLAYLWTTMQVRNFYQIEVKYPLAGFAAQYWPEHARLSDASQVNIVYWTRKLFAHNDFMQHWLKLHDPHVGYVTPDESGPALYYASLCGLDSCVEHLLNTGADANVRGGLYGSALHAASSFGNVRTALVLLEYGASINARDGHHGNALRAAVDHDNVPMLRFLLQHGADVGTDNEDRKSLLQVAAHRGVTEVIQILLDQDLDVEASTPYDTRTPLYIAASRGHSEAVRNLLDHSADVNAASENRSFPLHVALHNAHGEISILLIKFGADIHVRDGRYGSALCAAVSGKDLRLVNLLLQQAAPVNYHRGSDLETALYIAASVDLDDMVNILLEHEAEDHGNHHAAIRTACRRGNTEMAKTLLQHAAKNSRTSESHRDAIRLSCEDGNLELLKALIDAGADVQDRNVALTTASIYGHVEIVRFLLDEDADVDVDVLMEAACYNEQEKVVQLLLERGANPNAHCGPDTYHEGRSTLLCSAITSCLEDPKSQEAIINMLLDGGANINAQSKPHGNALQAACTLPDIHFRPDLVQLLLDRGATPNNQVEGHCSALCAVCINGRVEAVQMLLDKGAELTFHDEKYGNALVAASWPYLEHHPYFARKLGGDGARTTTKEEELDDLSCAADLSDHSEAVQALLDTSPLSGMGERHLEIVKMLLDKAADTNVLGVVPDYALKATCLGLCKEFYELPPSVRWRDGVSLSKKPDWWLFEEGRSSHSESDGERDGQDGEENWDSID